MRPRVTVGGAGFIELPPELSDREAMPDGVYELVAVCPDCDGTGLIHDGYWPCSHKSCGDGLPCPSCSVGTEQTEQNKRGQHDDHPELHTGGIVPAGSVPLVGERGCTLTVPRLAAAGDIIRRNTARTSDLISIGGGAYGVAKWDTLEEKEQEAWMALARKVITEGTP